MRRKINPWFIQCTTRYVYQNNHDLKFNLKTPLWIHVSREVSVFTSKQYFGKYIFDESYIGQLNINYFDIIKIVENEICSVEDRFFDEGYSPISLSPYYDENNSPDLDISEFSKHDFFQPKVGDEYRVITKKPQKRKLHFGTFYFCECITKNK